MGRLTLVLGGTKSGKSLFAEKLAKNYNNGNYNEKCKIAYLATAEIRDEEMADRVLRHKQRRPEEWITVEAPIEVETAILNLDKSIKFLIIDCITLYITNLLLQNETKIEYKSNFDNFIKSNGILNKIKTLCDVCKKAETDIVAVSNEVGFSIIPDNRLARIFGDIAGQSNQIIAEKADEVYIVIAGIAQRIK